MKTTGEKSKMYDRIMGNVHKLPQSLHRGGA